MRTHRRKVFLLEPETLIEFLTPGEHHYSVVRDGIPADARVMCWSHSSHFHRGLIAVKVESESFDPVEEATIIPTVSPLLRTCPGEVVKASEA